MFYIHLYICWNRLVMVTVTPVALCGFQIRQLSCDDWMNRELCICAATFIIPFSLPPSLSRSSYPVEIKIKVTHISNVLIWCAAYQNQCNVSLDSCTWKGYSSRKHSIHVCGWPEGTGSSDIQRRNKINVTLVCSLLHYKHLHQRSLIHHTIQSLQMHLYTYVASPWFYRCPLQHVAA